MCTIYIIHKALLTEHHQLPLFCETRSDNSFKKRLDDITREQLKLRFMSISSKYK